MEKKITYPLRVGRKQNRVVLDAAGLQIAEVSPAFPELAHEIVGYMNAKRIAQVGVNMKEWGTRANALIDKETSESIREWVKKKYPEGVIEVPAREYEPTASNNQIGRPNTAMRWFVILFGLLAIMVLLSTILTLKTK